VDTSDTTTTTTTTTPQTPPRPPSTARFLLFPSRQSKMPETESERELLAAPSFLPSDPESAESENRSWSAAAVGFLFDASCLNFFYYSV